MSNPEEKMISGSCSEKSTPDKLPLPLTAIGTELSVDIDGVPTRAVVAPIPFFDPEGTRLRA